MYIYIYIYHCGFKVQAGDHHHHTRRSAAEAEKGEEMAVAM